MPVLFVTTVTSTKINKIQILQNKFLRICLKAPWFMINRQINNDAGTPLINIWIKTQFKNVHAKLKNFDSVLVITTKEEKHTFNRRLRHRIPQDIRKRRS